MFRYQELWDLVENGFEDKKPKVADEQLWETRKKDAKALFYIQQAVDDSSFSSIAAASTSKQAWDIIQREYLGDQKVINVKLQTLRSDFEALETKKNESVNSFMSRVSAVVNEMKSYGEDIKSETVVSKVLRRLTVNYNHIVAAIMESRHLCTYTFDELLSSLLAHEDRLKRFYENVEEKDFQAKGEFYENAKPYSGGGRGRG